MLTAPFINGTPLQSGFGDDTCRNLKVSNPVVSADASPGARFKVFSALSDGFLRELGG
jgi:hypothetical protein